MLILASFGLTAILIDGKPTAPIRDLAGRVRLDGLFSCYLCLGFWSGLALGLILYWGDWLTVALSPLVASGTSWAIGDWVKAQVRIDFATEEDADAPHGDAPHADAPHADAAGDEQVASSEGSIPARPFPQSLDALYVHLACPHCAGKGSDGEGLPCSECDGSGVITSLMTRSDLDT